MGRRITLLPNRSICAGRYLCCSLHGSTCACRGHDPLLLIAWQYLGLQRSRSFSPWLIEGHDCTICSEAHDNCCSPEVCSASHTNVKIMITVIDTAAHVRLCIDPGEVWRGKRCTNTCPKHKMITMHAHGTEEPDCCHIILYLGCQSVSSLLNIMIANSSMRRQRPAQHKKGQEEQPAPNETKN